MNYNYTAYYKTDEERIKAIGEDILREYPNLRSLAYEAAKMETPFGQVHEDYDQFSNQENHINRLIDIVIITENNPNLRAEYQKACFDLIQQYQSWDHYFTYGGKEEQEVYFIMQAFSKHMRDKSVPLITFKEAHEIKMARIKAREDQENWERAHTMEYNYTAYYKTDEERIKAIGDDILREYPNLGPLAYEAAKMETPFGQVHEDYDQFSSQENHINRLIDIVILTENNPNLQAEYQKACKDLVKYYQSWDYSFTYGGKERQAAYLLMQRFYEHMSDKSIPLITFKEAEEIRISNLEGTRSR